MNMTTASLRPWTRAGAAVLAVGAFALAGCSSSSGSKSSDSGKTSSTSKAATSSTSKGSTSSTSSGSSTTCPTQSEVTTILGSGNTATGAPICAGGYAAGSYSNGQADVAYILVDENGTWTKASDAIAQEICTTNANKIPQQIVSAGCND